MNANDVADSAAAMPSARQKELEAVLKASPVSLVPAQLATATLDGDSRRRRVRVRQGRGARRIVVHKLNAVEPGREGFTLALASDDALPLPPPRIVLGEDATIHQPWYARVRSRLYDLMHRH